MKNKINSKKIYAFIDSQNLNLGVKSQGWILISSLLRKFGEFIINVGLFKEKLKVR